MGISVFFSYCGIGNEDLNSNHVSAHMHEALLQKEQLSNRTRIEVVLRPEETLFIFSEDGDWSKGLEF